MYKYPELVNTDLNLKLPEINSLEENDKNFFLDDYFLWLDKESKVIQKIEKMVCGIMWRNALFYKDLKEEFSKKSFAYKEFFDKDKNIKMSS
ncbi:hypothetical protein A7978_01960 [Borrelia turicatae]|uniref:Uncharacterized protein n=1 Tax=Borrelia turicatae TaxID=142 RepID=A0A172XBJ8_BORTU|nr:hypothetical protein [Borrelia turicatae]ANF33877.1 hypothetical protein A7978_01960 [Borrelia turicatae]UPA13246.1 hypothetical protein bt91E135_000391 [Borrelia turicatae 91E135]UPA14731.1 hypothetical protein btBTE5EL_000391 [Borrelia turicatae]